MSDFSDNLKPAGPTGPSTLSHERKVSNIPVDELSQHLLGREFLDRQSRILTVMANEPLFNKSKQLNFSRPERYHLGLARAKQIRRLSVKHGWDAEDDKMADYLCDDVSPYMLQLAMFITTVREQGNAEQREYWLPKIERWDIIGCYAQTELGHGSNVRGLELQARWHPKSKSFVLHSPSLTASKWWNGSMGRTANHAIVVAQLQLPDPAGNLVSYGPHSFIVQIRDMKTHQPLDGIIVGDIGPKYGYAPMDNGYLLFRNFRIPHSAMLSRYSRVDPQTGRYTKPENSAVVYGSLTAVRAAIVMHARLVLARAVTVAVRYTVVRRQFHENRQGDPTGPEMSVLDYPTVQIRILPLLATTMALHYTGAAMQELYTRARKNIEDGDFSELAELHSTSSGLKSLCTDLTANGIETCRRACGGHGFGGGSGLIQLNADYLSKPTVEGDNWMITQQTARYLIKQMTEAHKSDGQRMEKSSFGQACQKYLSQRSTPQPVSSILDNDSDEAIVKAFETRTLHQTHQAYTAQIVDKKPHNSLLVQFHNLSHAHSQYLLVSNFHSALCSSADLSPTLRHILRLLFRLFSYHTIDAHARAFQIALAVSSQDLDALPGRIQDLMAEIRPHAVSLVDGWGIPDFLLDSALGRYDGRVYEDLWNRAHRLNPLNESTFDPDWRSDGIVKGEGDGMGRVRSLL